MALQQLQIHYTVLEEERPSHGSVLTIIGLLGARFLKCVPTHQFPESTVGGKYTIAQEVMAHLVPLGTLFKCIEVGREDGTADFRVPW